MPPRDPHTLIERARTAAGDAGTAARILPLLDLTNLDENAHDAGIERLCARAVAHGVAAMCVHPRFVAFAGRRLAGTGVRLATVANFPHGGFDIAGAAEEVAAAVAEGAEEVEVVAPIGAVLEGDVGLVTEMVEACRIAARPETTLKVILETGALGEPHRITAAARAAIMGGAGFLKTSTGKAAIGATLEAAAVLLAVLDEAGGRVGLKVAGGIRTTAHAAAYLHLADELIGPGFVQPATFRIGATALLDDLLRTGR